MPKCAHSGWQGWPSMKFPNVSEETGVAGNSSVQKEEQVLSTRVLWIPVSLVWLGMAGALAQAPSPNSDDVTDYAKLCYQRLGIKETDVPATLKCSDGGNLPISVDMAVKDDFQASCDKPVWLNSGVLNAQCYGKNTRIQEIPIAGVTGARNKVRGIL